MVWRSVLVRMTRLLDGSQVVTLPFVRLSPSSRPSRSRRVDHDTVPRAYVRAIVGTVLYTDVPTRVKRVNDVVCVGS